jgi:hypothetical protein
VINHIVILDQRCCDDLRARGVGPYSNRDSSSPLLSSFFLGYSLLMLSSSIDQLNQVYHNCSAPAAAVSS